MKDESRSSIAVYGDRSAVACGINEMPTSCVANWDTVSELKESIVNRLATTSEPASSGSIASSAREARALSKIAVTPDTERRRAATISTQLSSVKQLRRKTLCRRSCGKPLSARPTCPASSR